MPCRCPCLCLSRDVKPGRFALQCHSFEDSAYASEHSPFQFLLHTMALSSFDPSADFLDGVACDAYSPSTRYLAFGIFWFLIVMLTLICLNALIAIMGNSYQTLQERWEEISMKTWAEITADIISQWVRPRNSPIPTTS